MENITTKTLKLKKDITLVSLDGANALLDIEQKCYFNPNDTAFFLLKLTEDGISDEELVDHLASEFDVSIDRASDDVNNFITELSNLGILEITYNNLKTNKSPVVKMERKQYLPPNLMNREALIVSAASAPETVAPKWA